MTTRRWMYTTPGCGVAMDINVSINANAEDVERRVREHWKMGDDEPVSVWPATGPSVSEMDSEQFRTL